MNIKEMLNVSNEELVKKTNDFYMKFGAKDDVDRLSVEVLLKNLEEQNNNLINEFKNCYFL